MAGGQPTKRIVYVGVSESMEIAESGQLARFGEPVEVVDRPRKVRHVIDDQGNYQDVEYPGLATRLLETPNWIAAPEGAKDGVAYDAQPKKAQKPLDEAAAAVDRLERSETNMHRLLIEQGLDGDIDEIVIGAPGHALQAPQDPVVVPAGEASGQTLVQPEPPQNVLRNPDDPGQQTGPVEGEDVKEPDKEPEASGSKK
jgi:hypothetical protein